MQQSAEEKGVCTCVEPVWRKMEKRRCRWEGDCLGGGSCFTPGGSPVKEDTGSKSMTHLVLYIRYHESFTTHTSPHIRSYAVSGYSEHIFII